MAGIALTLTLSHKGRGKEVKGQNGSGRTTTEQTYIRNIFGTLRNDSCFNLDYGDAKLGYQFFNKFEYHAWYCAFDDIFVCSKTVRIGCFSFNYSFGNNVPFGSFYCLNKTYFG